jgi:hypothetical protein
VATVKLSEWLFQLGQSSITRNSWFSRTPLAITLYQGNHDRIHKPWLRNIYSICSCCNKRKYGPISSRVFNIKYHLMNQLDDQKGRHQRMTWYLKCATTNLRRNSLFLLFAYLLSVIVRTSLLRILINFSMIYFRNLCHVLLAASSFSYLYFKFYISFIYHRRYTM